MEVTPFVITILYGKQRGNVEVDKVAWAHGNFFFNPNCLAKPTKIVGLSPNPGLIFPFFFFFFFNWNFCFFFWKLVVTNKDNSF